MLELALRQRTGAGPCEEPTRSDAPPKAPIDAPAEPRTSRSRSPVPRLVRAVLRLEAAALAMAIGWAAFEVAGVYGASVDAPRIVAGVHAGGLDVGGLDAAAALAVTSGAAQATLDRPLVLSVAGATFTSSARALGAVAAPESAVATLTAIGHSGNPWLDLRERMAAWQGTVDVPIGYRFDDARALSTLLDIAPQVDRPSQATRIDLERRRVEPAVRGTALLAHDALSVVAVGLASGASTIDLPHVDKEPVADDPLAAWVGLDIGTVIGSFDTPYSLDAKEADRAFNLKVGATKLAGFVLQPGETFSFNDVVGPRTPENGFRYGGGITGGELVDVLGGGICQISSTLYGAAFFAGLEVVEHRPHSRPSSYVDMALDATVVWPDVDLRLRNPFDFPVVLHMVVRQGKVHAEVLGASRPYQVAFEREIIEALPFGTIWRNDNVLRAGTKVVSQRGMRGFKVKRTRKIYQAGDLLREESRELTYPPTSEIFRHGTNPSGVLPEEKPYTPLRDPAAHLRIVQ